MLERRAAVDVRLPSHGPHFGVLCAATAITWAFCLELTYLTFYTFHRWSGLYFYSIIISSWGCTFHALAWTLKYLTPVPNILFLVIVEIGWVSMITGQSLVLYSRLHLVVRNPRILRAVLVMIIVDGVCLHGSTIIGTAGTTSHPDDKGWLQRANILERVQLPIFCVQESILSIIYIVCTVRMLKSTHHSRARAVMRKLIVVNGLCLAMDGVLIGFEYANDHVSQTSLKPMLYAFKIKLEFLVLNQLMTIVHKGLTEQHGPSPGGHTTLNPNSHEEPPSRHAIRMIDTGALKSFSLTDWLKGRSPMGSLSSSNDTKVSDDQSNGPFGSTHRSGPKHIPIGSTPGDWKDSGGGYGQPSLGFPKGKPEPRDHLPEVREEIEMEDINWGQGQSMKNTPGIAV